MAGYAYIEPQECAEGIWWCPRCACAQEFDVAAGYRRGDDAAPLDCLVCGHQIGFASIRVETYPFPPVETQRPTMTAEERQAGRLRLQRRMFGELAPLLRAAAAQAAPPDLETALADEMASIRRGR